jgi:hypothetical protein
MNTRPQIAEAKNEINKAFDDVCYATKHPELVGQYLIAQAIQELDETLASTVQRIFDLYSGTGPLFKFLGIK